MHISVSLWIGLLRLCVTANVPRLSPELWSPFQNHKDFARSADEFYRQRSAISHDERPSSSLSSASEGLSIQETNALDYFQVMYPTGQALGRTRMLVQDAMVYLVRKESTSLDLLRSWKSRLVNVLDDNPTGEVAATIAYAVYTLILKNHGKTDETGILSSILPQYMERIHHWYAQSYPEGAPVWEREIFAPHTGLSTSLQSWGTFRQQLESEPTLKHISEAISQQRHADTSKMRKDVQQIFSPKPSPNLFSSHTRVAAIALLFHAMHNNDERTSQPAAKIANLLLKEKMNYPLFDHEKILLTRLYNDYEDASRPNRQVPL